MHPQKASPDYATPLRNLLAIEYNCAVEDFTKKENILTVSKILDGRRMYSPEKYFFHMVTTGDNAVITADECLHPFLQEFIKDRMGHWLFEIPNLKSLEKELNKFGDASVPLQRCGNLPCNAA